MPSNCYGYAWRIDLSICPGTRNGRDSVVNRWSEGLKDHPFIPRQKEVLIAACIRDGLRQFDGARRQITAFVHKYKRCIDYHFMRLDDDNTWSGQDSTGGPIVTGIRDPIKYNKDLVGTALSTGVLKAQMYAGLLYLPSGDDHEDGWL